MSDDTVACNKAAQHASEIRGELAFPPGVYLISDYIRAQPGIRRISGQGGTIRCAETPNETGVLLAGKASGYKENIKLCSVTGLQIDCGAGLGRIYGIYGQNVSDCSFVDNYVYGLREGAGLLLRSLAGGGEQGQRNSVRRNRIESRAGSNAQNVGIAVDAGLRGSTPTEDAPAHWRRLHSALNASFPTSTNEIAENVVYGTYYGLALSAARDCLVAGNHFASNVRNISVQNGCTGNLILNNRCSDSESSAIHLAYASRFNRIIRNKIQTRRATGEGLLQAYVGSSDNEFLENDLSITSPALPKYCMYTGCHSDRNRFVGNVVRGRCSKAYVAIESAFSNKCSDRRHYSFGLELGPEHFSSRGMQGVLVEDNVFDTECEATLFFLAQISDHWGVYPLHDCRIVGNRVVQSNAQSYVYFHEQTPGALYNMLLEDNRWPTSRKGCFLHAPRGRNHFQTPTDELLSLVATCEG